MKDDFKKEFGPSSWAIDNKTAVYVLTAIIAIMGYLGYQGLPKENFPEVLIPKIFVSTIYPGTSPANMETLVTKQIEKELKSTKGLKKVTSNSYQNFSIITAEFNTNVEVADAKQRVKDAVDKAKQDLPNDLPNDPTVSDINLADMPIMYLNLSGDYDLKSLKKYAKELQDRIESFKEISGVDIVGALEQEVQINVDLNKMSAAKISFTDIENAVKYENATISGGDIKMDGLRRTLNVKKEFTNADQIANLIIKTPTGSSVYLRDIAEVKDSFKEQNSYASLYGKNVITLNVKKRSGENLIEASDKINALIKEMKGTSLPKNLNITVTGDQSDQTRVTLHDLINTIIIGFILVTIILMFFMGVKNALFVALSVPLSMFIAFITMPALGGLFGFNFTMNMIVLFSFLLGLGIVVDDAIVVIENTHRIFNNGKVPIVKAAKAAAGEVFMPVLSGTLTTLAPFVPLLFWPGIIGEFMFFLPVTLIITLLASLVVAYIINPVFAVDFMEIEDHETHKPKFDKKVKKTVLIMAGLTLLAYLIAFGLGNFMVLMILLYLLNHFYLENAVKNFQNNLWPRFQASYARLLTKALNWPRAMLFGTFGLLVFSFVLMFVVPPKVVFFPEGDPNFIYVYLNLPIGTDQAHTNEVIQQLEKKVTNVVGKDNKDVSSIISNVTVGVTDPQDEDQGEYTNKGKITVAFVEFGKRTGAETSSYLSKIREAVKGVPGAEITVAKEQGGPPTAKPISIEITGDDLDSLVKTSESLKKYIVSKKIDGIEELKSDFLNNKPEIVFDLDRERANREGLSSGQIGLDLRTAIFGKDISKFRDVDEDYDITLRSQENQRNNLDALRNMKMTYRDMGMGGIIRQVPLSSFANIDYVNTYGGIKRKQQKRIIILSSNVLASANPNEVVAKIQSEINEFKVPTGVEVKMAGEQEEQLETAAFLGRAMLIALGLILVILVAQFNSITKPMIILSEILFSIIGVILGITIFGMEMSVVMSGIGIVALAGIVVRNGILLVEFTDLLIEQGMPIKEAVIEAGRTRMTPVLLTATATMLGLIPLAVGLNMDFTTLFTEFNPHLYFGGDNVAFWGPLSWTMIFGLAFATFLTLVLVPCMYLLGDVNSKLIKGWFKKKPEAVDPFAKTAEEPAH
ncbi:efflux RND transporter permease subunit [Pedobacter polaris]|uniref:Efflux RND transporter permease subunit n=1 Tax=Pedobacter polaris TaxID=2571273 RepID=A0A4U1CWT1_9SPHI|nr:efflux RND transporter permease subunit [Pedobacter polaris]TKC13226.1 efflux RND transporter permease subunit [Pedobacter polaris]